MTTVSLKLCDENVFFQTLERCVDCIIPVQLKNILTITSYNSAIAMSVYVNVAIAEMEDFMRTHFNQSMIRKSDNLVDYLGIFEDDPMQFQLLCGQKRMLYVLFEHCTKLYPQQAVQKPTVLPRQSPDDPPAFDDTDLPTHFVPSLLLTSGV